MLLAARRAVAMRRRVSAASQMRPTMFNEMAAIRESRIASRFAVISFLTSFGLRLHATLKPRRQRVASYPSAEIEASGEDN